MIQFWTIPDPPPDVTVRLERADDAVEISGASTKAKRLPAEQPAPRGTSPVLLFTRVFMGFWTYGAMAMLGFGVIFCLVALGLVLFGGVPITMNDKPLGTGIAVASILAFLTAWIVIGIVMLRGGRHMRSVLAVASGNAPARQWHLRIERNRIIAIQEEMGKTTSRNECVHEDVRNILVKHDGYLVAELAHGSSVTKSDIVLAGPLNQRDADWLEETLRQLLGVRS